MLRAADPPFDNPADMMVDPGIPSEELPEFRREMKALCIYRMELAPIRLRNFASREVYKVEPESPNRESLRPKAWNNTTMNLLKTVTDNRKLQEAFFLPLDPSMPCPIAILPNEMLTRVLDYAINGEDVLLLERIGCVSRHFYELSHSNLLYRTLFMKAIPDSGYYGSPQTSFRDLYFTLPHPYFNGFYASRIPEPIAIPSIEEPCSSEVTNNEILYCYRVVRLYPNGDAIYTEITEEDGISFFENRIKQFRRSFKGKWTLRGDKMSMNMTRVVQKSQRRFDPVLREHVYHPINGSESHVFEFKLIPDSKHRYDLHYIKDHYNISFENDEVHMGLVDQTANKPRLHFFFNEKHICLITNF